MFPPFYNGEGWWNLAWRQKWCLTAARFGYRADRWHSTSFILISPVGMVFGAVFLLGIEN